MAKTLSRSKSLRLRSPRQNAVDEESPKLFAKDDLHSSAATTRLDRGAAPAAVSGNPKHAKPTDTSPTRPSTAGGAMHRNQAGGALTIQYSGSENSNDAKGHAPISPTVFWAAEVHTNQGAHSAPLESGTSKRATPAIRPPPKVPGNHSSSDRADSLQSTDKREEMEDSSKHKVKRWKSLRGIFGSKKAGTYDRSTRLTPPFGDFSGLQSPATAPTRVDRSPLVSARAWSDNERTPAKLNKPLPAITSPQYTAPVPPTPPTNHQRDGGFQGGHRYRGGTTTKPMIDVDIPTTEMERYSVMFGGLLRSNTQPNLLVRRQASKINPLQVDTPKPRDHLHVKQEPATPRSQARYQLSLFPPSSPRSAEVVNPLRMHKRSPLQRSQTSPAPRSPTAIRANYQLSASSNTLSEEVPLRLDVTTESAYLAPPPAHGLTIKTPELNIPNTEVMLLTPTPSTATSSRFSFISEEDDVDVHVAGPLRPAAKEPMWEMMTPSPSASGSTSGRDTLHRSESQTTAATSITSYSDDVVVVEQHAQVQVSVAKSMSVTRAKSTKRYLEPKTALIGRTHKSNERLVDRKPLTPTLVELRSRKSQQVQIEGF